MKIEAYTCPSCGGAEPTPETSAAALETITEAPETFTEAPETAAATTAETTVVTEEAYTQEVTTEPTATTENRYHTEGWDAWSGYVYMEVKRNESTLAGGPDNNLLSVDYVLLPPMVYTK